tara:strand:+ start:25384 stop:25851 length:468 start_codon:yes stop_codon:yes gene_type:complete
MYKYLFILFYLFIFSCDELTLPIFDCTDNTACNYNEDATNDDGTCIYDLGCGCGEAGPIADGLCCSENSYSRYILMTTTEGATYCAACNGLIEQDLTSLDTTPLDCCNGIYGINPFNVDWQPIDLGVNSENNVGCNTTSLPTWSVYDCSMPPDCE